MRTFATGCLIVAAFCGVARAAETDAERIAAYDRCHAVGKVLVRIAGDDATILVRARKQERIFRNLAFHTRRSAGEETAPAMVATLRARIKAVKEFGELFKASGGKLPENFGATAKSCAAIYGEVAKQQPPSPVYLWPEWEAADDPGYGKSCGNPVRTGGTAATGDVLKSGGAGVSLSYYWLGTLRGSDGKNVDYKRKGSGDCPNHPELGIVDFWIIDGEDAVVAPYAAGMPKLPQGYKAVY